MDMMTQIRQMQAEAFLNAGFTPDEVAKKFGIVPIKKEPEPALVAVSVERTGKNDMSAARAARAAIKARTLAIRKPIIEDGFRCGMTLAQIGKMIGEVENTKPLQPCTVFIYAKQNGITRVRSADALADKIPASNSAKPPRKPKALTANVPTLAGILAQNLTHKQISYLLSPHGHKRVREWFSFASRYSED